jgi:hypothetical protein
VIFRRLKSPDFGGMEFKITRNEEQPNAEVLIYSGQPEFEAKQQADDELRESQRSVEERAEAKI